MIEFINDKITEAAKKLMGDDMNIPLGASIGCVFVPMSGNDFIELYKKADKALYTTKQNGKHGYSVYTEETNESSEEDGVNISQIEMILGERNIDEGAYVLPFETFRIVYRFLKRSRGIYGKNSCLVIFTMKQHKEGSLKLSQAVDDFFTVARATLRQGDVITQNGKNQFFVILTNADAQRDVNSAVRRIGDRWERTPSSGYYTFAYEWTLVDA